MNTGGGRGIPRVGRFILGVFARPWLLALALGFARVVRALGIARLFARLPGRAGFAAAMLASSDTIGRRQAYMSRGDGTRGTSPSSRGLMQGI